jgi:hypothetical protein
MTTLRRLCLWLTPLAVLVLCAGVVWADEGETTGPEHSPPVLGYFLAFVFTVATLVILCMPSRKS